MRVVCGGACDGDGIGGGQVTACPHHEPQPGYKLQDNCRASNEGSRRFHNHREGPTRKVIRSYGTGGLVSIDF